MKDYWVEKFKRNVLPKLTKKFKVKQAILIGSRAKGENNKSSDIDVILISENFRLIPFVNRMGTILQEITFDKHIDFLCYTPDEFEKIQKTSSIIADALKKKKEIPISPTKRK